MKVPNELLEQFPLIISFPLHWGDQDTLGHVNNLAYLRWAETARIEYFSRTGIWHGLASETRGPILANICCDFRLPLTYPDTVYAGARMSAAGNSSLKMDHRIVSGNRGAVAADLESILVWFDYIAGKPMALPAEVRTAFEDFEGKPLPRLTRNG
jgi:acyl-CoA thioester hydrolase